MWGKAFASISCSMNFSRYPFDYQTCYFEVGSAINDILVEVHRG